MLGKLAASTTFFVSPILPIEIFAVSLAKKLAYLDTGIVHEDTEPAECLNGSFDRSPV